MLDADLVGSSDDPDGPSPLAAPAARRDVVAYTCMGLMVLIGSTTALSAKLAVRELPVAWMPLFRFGVAGLALLPFALRAGALRGLLRHDWPRLLLAGLLCVPMNQGFFLFGTRLAPTTHVGLIYATCPLVVLLAAWAAGQEKMRADRLVGVLASVAGLLVLGLGNLVLPASVAPGAAARSFFVGDLLLVGAVVTWGLFMTISKPLIARHGAVPTLAGTFLFGTLLNIPLALFLSPPGSSIWHQIANASPAAWYGLVHITMIVSVLGLICQSVALRRLDASEVATVGNAAPLMTVVWGYLLLGEAITPFLIVGGALTLGGILWTGRTSARRPATPPTPIPLPRSLSASPALAGSPR
jgi:drug/metabolite transporter (DMT)-like permease